MNRQLIYEDSLDSWLKVLYLCRCLIGIDHGNFHRHSSRDSRHSRPSRLYSSGAAGASVQSGRHVPAVPVGFSLCPGRYYMEAADHHADSDSDSHRSGLCGAGLADPCDWRHEVCLTRGHCGDARRHSVFPSLGHDCRSFHRSPCRRTVLGREEDGPGP